MDTGLKRLWARRKSRGSDSRKDSRVSSLRKSQSTEQSHHSPSRSLETTHDRNNSIDPERHHLGPFANSGDLPILGGYGISRPSTSRSRAATEGKGSMLSALNRAADAVAQAEHEYQVSADWYTSHHKGPRYVDIFSLSSSNNPNPRPDYNEEVAARNLELVRVALEDGFHQYVSTSKYQEEVPARNAIPQLSGSFTTFPSNDQAVFDGSQPPTQFRGAASPLSGYSPSPRRLQNHSFSRPTNQNRDPSRIHVRQHSDRSGQSQPHFPDLNSPQESVTSEIPADALSGYQLSPSEEAQMKFTGFSSYFQSHDPSIRSPSNLSNPATPTRSINLSNRTIMDLTSDDRPSIIHESPFHSRSSSFPEHPNGDTMRRIQGSVIAGPYTERRQTQSILSPLPSMPVASTEASEPAGVSQPRPPSLEPRPRSPRLGSPPLAGHSPSSFAPIFTVASASPRTSVVMDKLVPPIAMTDLQHTPEASGNQKQEVGKPTTNSALPDDDLISQQHNSSFETAKPPMNTEIGPEPTNLPADSNGVRSELPEALEPVVDQKQEGDKHATNPALPGDDMKSEQGSSAFDSAMLLPNMETAPKLTTLPAESGSSRSGFMEAITKQTAILSDDLDSISATGPYKHLPSRSLDDANDALAVKTRDFAIAPTKSTLTSVPDGIESNSDNHAINLRTGARSRKGSTHSTYTNGKTHSRKGSSHSTHTNGMAQKMSPYASTFNEEEFAQKQAEAREALVRLQLSLDEDFLTQPATAPAGSPARPGPPKHIASFSDGKPAAPSALIARLSQSELKAADEPTELDSAARPETAEISYHRLTTSPQPSSAGGQNGGSMHSESNSPKKGDKGKQRADVDLDGPVPSFFIHAANQPLPPLPPLSPLYFPNQPIHQSFPSPKLGVPTSPGEIPLSNSPFPMSSPRQSVRSPAMASSSVQERSPARTASRPTSQLASQHPFPGSPSGMKEQPLRRKSSTKSQSSSTSAFSIPYHMIPERTSSIRDRSVMEVDL